jgi:phosphotransferase system  glucose/maltose/N-acetylglucosamine-specific IIC component
LKYILLIISTLFIFINANAFVASTGTVGVGYYSQNAINKISTSKTGSTGFLGSPTYPLLFKYDWAFGMDWFFSPQLSYTLLPHESADGATKTTIMNMIFAFGKNSTDWDWSFGPGLISYSAKGSGGSKVLSNGTSTSTFALPGRSVTAQSISSNLGFGYNLSQSRIGFDLIIENLLSSKKRSESFMLSYSYRFGGGF